MVKGNQNHKTGRNDPCHCGSGKKYKKCCLKKDRTNLKILNSNNANLTAIKNSQGEKIRDNPSFKEMDQKIEGARQFKALTDSWNFRWFK